MVQFRESGYTLASTRDCNFHVVFKHLFFVIGLVLTSFSVLATEKKLSLDDAQALAINRSRQLSGLDFAVASARESAIAAAQLPDPVLKMGIDNLPVSGPDSLSFGRDFMTMRRIGLMQELTATDKRQLRTDRFHRTADKTQAEKEQVTTEIASNTAIAWFDLYYALANLTIIDEQMTQSKAEFVAAEGEYRTGRGSQADIFLARGADILVQDRRSEAHRRVLNAKTMLRRWVGDGVAMSLGEKPEINRIPLDPVLLGTQMQRHPQILRLQRQIDIAEADAKIAQADKKSDWSLELALQQRGPGYSKMISVGISLPLQWDQKQRQDRELSSKLALVEQAKAELDEVQRSLLAQIQALIDEWQSDRERLHRFEQELLPIAKQRSIASFAAYRGGKSSLTELLGTSRSEIELRQQALQLEATIARLWAQLAFLFRPNSAHPILQSESENQARKSLP